ncbi:MAG: hypothetical protein HY929_01610 [Euryarchaeota archaeon]|nr:hypothetical protein [Euryarchaeota archaeon]
MECLRCDGKLEKKLATIEAGGISFTDEYFVCSKCGKMYPTKDQIKKMYESSSLRKLSFERKISMSGRTYVIRVPQTLEKLYEIQVGKKVKIAPLDAKRMLVEFE